MLETYSHGVVDFLTNHPSWGTALTFLIAFTESIAVIGTIIPGSVTMTAIGALVGAGIMPAFWTFCVATVGALCGDLLSYWLGRHYDERLAQMWPFSKHPDWIETGKAFFAKHGTKSVMIGRFFGPVRSIVPTIAGMLHMTAPRFFLAAVPSAFLWAVAYMLPGVLIGALSSELPAGTSAKFIIYILLFILVVWLLFWVTQLILSKVWKSIDALISRAWQAMRARPAWKIITTPLADAREPNLHEQLTLVFGTFIAIICLIFILYSATHAGIVTAFNDPAHYLIQSLRTPMLDNIMAFITLMGERNAILMIATLILAWLTWQKYYRAALHWLLLMVLIFVTVMALKVGWYNPRPHPELVRDTISSLPSGHTAFIMAIFGFIAFLISRELPSELKPYPYLVAGIVTLFVAFSRVYLGAHWLSDVIVGIMLGLICIMLTIISYRRRPTTQLSSKAFTIACIVIILLVWIPYAIYFYRHEVVNNRVIWPASDLTLSYWYGHYNPQIPIMRNNRLGKPIDPLNIEWQGDLGEIRELLEARGWVYRSTELDIKSTLRRLSLKTPRERLPLLPNLYHNHHPALLMTKSIPDKKYFLVLHLWPSDLRVAKDSAPLWLGNIEQRAPTMPLLPVNASNQENSIVDVISELESDLENEDYFELVLPEGAQKSVPQNWLWQRKVLQIKSDN